MSTFRLVTSATVANPNVGDLYLDDSGQLELIGTDVSDTDDYALSVAQSVTSRLLFIKGEWYQDQRLGTPWRERIWKKGVTETTVRQMVQQVILATPGVRALESIDVDIDVATRSVTISDLQIVAETGQIVTVVALDEPMIIPASEASI
jgi:hypothetical protein